jgi:hypothetical protein
LIAVFAAQITPRTVSDPEPKQVKAKAHANLTSGWRWLLPRPGSKNRKLSNVTLGSERLASRTTTCLLYGRLKRIFTTGFLRKYGLLGKFTPSKATKQTQTLCTRRQNWLRGEQRFQAKTFSAAGQLN